MPRVQIPALDNSSEAPREYHRNPSKEAQKKEFSRRVYNLMLDKSWNQAELSRRSGIGRDSVSQYVNGHALPSPISAKKLAQAFGVSIKELYPEVVKAVAADEIPSLSVLQSKDNPQKAYLQINKEVSTGVAFKILALLNDADADRS